MQSSHLSKFVSEIRKGRYPQNDSESSGSSRYKTLLQIVTYLMRLITGGTLAISGFVKAIDPWGTIYKIDDYLSAMHLTIWPGLIIAGAFLLCAIEFLTGVFLLTGCFRKGATVLGFIIICFMTPLTLWIAIADPVADCGCFGDAFILSNWATFWKNIVLLLCFIWLLKYNKIVRSLISASIQWLAVTASLGYIGLIEVAGFFYQPLIDFRQFKVGTEIATTDNQINDEEPEYLFTYQKDGLKQDFQLDSLPDEDEGWEFVERKELKNTTNTVEPSSHSEFHIWDSNNDDVTQEILGENPDIILLMMPKLGNVSIAQTWKINYLYDWAKSNGYEFIAVVSGSKPEIENWKDLSMPEYSIYTSDDTIIKEIVRGNPAIVFVKDGKINWKNSLRTIDISNFKKGVQFKEELNTGAILENISLIYISVIALLIMISFSFQLREYIASKTSKNRRHE